MKINDAKKLLLEYFTNSWNNKTPISYDNKDDSLPKTKLPWVRVSVRLSSGGQVTLGSTGNRFFRRQGFLIFQVFTLVGEGTKKSDLLIQDILDIFDGISIANITIQDGSPTYTGVDGKWYQQNVQFRIIFDELK